MSPCSRRLLLTRLTSGLIVKKTHYESGPAHGVCAMTPDIARRQSSHSTLLVLDPNSQRRTRGLRIAWLRLCARPACVGLAGFFTVAQFSFWGNYLPRVYPTHLRGTGESFSANIGGRMIGTSAALITTQLANTMPGATPFTKLAYSAAAVAALVYLMGFIASFWLPEPKQEKLPD